MIAVCERTCVELGPRAGPIPYSTHTSDCHQSVSSYAIDYGIYIAMVLHKTIFQLGYFMIIHKIRLWIFFRSATVGRELHSAGSRHLGKFLGTHQMCLIHS